MPSDGVSELVERGVITGARKTLLPGKLVAGCVRGTERLYRFIHDNPTVVMLALGFLLMIGATLIADAFGVHVPKGYIYAAMAFSGAVEGLNMAARKKADRRKRAG